MKGRLTFPFLDSTNKTGMSKQKERRKEGGKKNLFIFDFHTKAFKARGGKICAWLFLKQAALKLHP